MASGTSLILEDTQSAQSPRIRQLCSIRWQFRVLIFLLLCSCVSYFVVLRHYGNEKPFASIHLDSGFNVTDDNAPFVMIFPHSTSRETDEKTLIMKLSDDRAIGKLREFLDSMKEFDGATCLHPSTNNSVHLRTHGEINLTLSNMSVESSWCRFIKRNWSVHIRNTGSVQTVKLLRGVNSTTIEETIMFQNCNILRGPFAIRKEVYHTIGGMLEGFGRVTLLEFFLRSKGKLKMAKLTNCSWSSEITREDRRTLEGSNNFSEYASLGNKHQVLRIVTESRIEWTACVANWKLCPEKPYVKPRSLPNIAAPICCSVVLGQMLVDFTRALDRLGLQYRLAYGTLLGAVRSQAIIPWTFDIDIWISQTEFVKPSTFVAFQKELGNQYYVGDSFMGMPRGHMLQGPYLEVETGQFFDGPDDLEGNALFSDEIEAAVTDMLPLSYDWRSRGYVDLYCGDSERMSGYSLVTINNQTFSSVKDPTGQLTKWYGENYRQPTSKGNWTGLSDEGHAPPSNC